MSCEKMVFIIFTKFAIVSVLFTTKKTGLFLFKNYESVKYFVVTPFSQCKMF